MPNTLNIPEYTLAELADATSAANTNGNWDTKKVARATDHDDNTLAATEDTDKMALFECKARGKPWTKTDNTLEKIIFEGDGVTAVPTNVGVIIPNWDYADFA